MSRRARAAAVLRRWWAREPVRVRVYSALLPVVALLVARGVLVESDVPYATAAILAIMGISGAESARANVTPWHEPRHAAPEDPDLDN